MEEFMLRALLAGVGVALAAGPLGVFVVWRRMAYFGDALSHSALLGVAIGLVTGISMNLTIAAVCLVVAAGVTWLGSRKELTSDATLGIFSHAALSLGMVVASRAEGAKVDLNGFLFGDLLASGWEDVAWIWSGGLLVAALLVRHWSGLVNLTVHEGLAFLDGVNVFRLRILFMLLTALVTAAAIKVVGALLITALLVIPPSAARAFSATPEGMALRASLIGAVSAPLGLVASYRWDLPSGPAIVLAAVCFFLISLPFGGRR
ncbi:MAG: metal ABC transporter permease [Magnetococcales bacterium]|nr:metal ABC transporter permease [Magnetococcales bacterium]